MPSPSAPATPPVSAPSFFSIALSTHADACPLTLTAFTRVGASNRTGSSSLAHRHTCTTWIGLGSYPDLSI
ncbi:hypothetical protein PR003_g18319 [Phytophthora rubi]|uniref:Uncharacterized protein n=1 Tax=Phytophthora rubi TaxID=129364 RepID=A0A6A4E880_9STRA|nr:hypothetical protein PR002_g17758 [Phytophthora rubi]KAE9318098.1 hypothetical protein PR003_g18319 [Phytophthora rubi]